jgi:GNAT superfamily N-acetyltransferase
MSEPAFEIVELGAGDLDRIEPLWMELVEFHREVVEGAWPVRSGEDAWAKRRPQYEGWLASGAGTIFAAAPKGEPDGELLGYATLVIEGSSPSWAMGEKVGEVETLVVAESARGAGIGKALLEACRDRLKSEGIAFWFVAVVEVNEPATRLYESSGFQPFYRNLAGRL